MRGPTETSTPLPTMAPNIIPHNTTDTQHTSQLKRVHPFAPYTGTHHITCGGLPRQHNMRVYMNNKIHRLGRIGRALHTYTRSRTIGTPAHVHVHALTYNKDIPQAVHAKHCTGTHTSCKYTHAYSRTIGASPRPQAEYCTRTRTSYKYTHTHSRTIGALLRLPTPTTVHVHVYCARTRTRTQNDRCIAQAVHTEHCTRTRTVLTYTHSHSRTIGASLRLSVPSTVHIHVQGARTRTRTHIQ